MCLGLHLTSISSSFQHSLPQNHRQGEPCCASCRVWRGERLPLLDSEELMGNQLGDWWVILLFNHILEMCINYRKIIMMLSSHRYFLIERGKNMCGLAACSSFPEVWFLHDCTLQKGWKGNIFKLLWGLFFILYKVIFTNSVSYRVFMSSEILHNRVSTMIG